MKYEFDVEFDVSICTISISVFNFSVLIFTSKNKYGFQIPVTFPTTVPEIAIPELDGKTAKMYRGGKICLSDHFKPLWAKNVPKFGIAHAMALGVRLLHVFTCQIHNFIHFYYFMFPQLGPWLAVEVPDLIEKGLVQYKDKTLKTC